MIDKFEKILSAIRIAKHDSKYFKKLFKGGGSLASYQLNISIKNYIPEIKTIFDVGANQGQFALAAKEIFSPAKIYSFEPVPEVFEILKKNIGDAKDISIYNTALGSSEGELDFYKNDFSHASSAFPIHQNQVDMLPETSKTTAIKVKVDKLENFMATVQYQGPVLLKLDVQGFEKQVIIGAGEMIKKIDYLLFETSFIEMYSGEPLFDEMHSFVKGLGYELIAPVGFMQTKEFKIPQMDLLYKRTNK